MGKGFSVQLPRVEATVSQPTLVFGRWSLDWRGSAPEKCAPAMGPSSRLLGPGGETMESACNISNAPFGFKRPSAAPKTQAPITGRHAEVNERWFQGWPMHHGRFERLCFSNWERRRDTTRRFDAMAGFKIWMILSHKLSAHSMASCL